MINFEEELQKSFFSSNNEKSFIDKLLSKEESNRIRELIKKEKLERSDLLELLYLLSGTEAKLLNYGPWDRYVILKFFVWIREFTKIAEMLFDYKDDLERKKITCFHCKELFKDLKKEKAVCKCKEPKSSLTITIRTKKLLYNNERFIEHNTKFLVDLYLNIARTGLSVGATGFLELLKNKFEVSYPQQMGSQNNPTAQPTTLAIKR